MEAETLTRIGLGVGTTLLLLLLLDLVERGMPEDLTKGNAARRLLRVGQVLGAFLIAAAAVKNGVQGGDLAHDAMWSLGGGVAGLAMLEVTGKIGVRLLLSASLSAELQRGNAAAGLAAGAQYLATGILVSQSIGGRDLASVALSFAFFALSILTLQVFVALFRGLTTYDDAEQIAGENLAASLSYAGVSVALAIVVGRAVEGDFVTWAISLRGYGGVLVSAIAFYPVRQLFVQKLVLRAPLRLRGGAIDDGIARDRDVGLAALEASSYLATALAIARLA